MKVLITFCASAVLIIATGSANADMAVIDFESLDIGTVVDDQFSYLGADFNGDATVTGSLSSSFPLLPESSKVIFNYPSYDLTRVDAVGPEWMMAGGHVTGTYTVTLTAYDSSDTPLITDSTGGDNTFNKDKPNTTNMLLSVSAPNIAYVKFSIIESGTTFTIDDFKFNPVPVPAAVLLGMLGLGVAGMKLRKFV
ncbi:MAG TPA: hypothetical protein DIU00_11190 [Phycisphaerales bacterium]|nr:hypothetical protein [Phycisphaerales bacterium]